MSSSPQIPLLLLIVNFTFCAHRCFALSPDGLSLLAFKSAITSDPTAALSDWNPTDTDPCRWSGVTCSNISGYSFLRVVAVSVSGKNLSGYVPSELGRLVFLRRLNLHGNLLSGNIPPELSNATSLHSLFLYSNNFKGSFPTALCDLLRLQNLDLSDNSLSGVIPSDLKKCRQLQRLLLAGNLFSGFVPTSIWPELQNLVQLDLSSNNFTGPIPPDIGGLFSMTGILNMSHNHFDGEIPTSLGKLPAVVTLDLRNNDLSGEIPRVGALENQGAVCFLGNPRLCGDPLPSSCKFPTSATTGNQSNIGNPVEKDGSRGRLSAGWIILISAADAVGVAIVGLVLIYVYWKVKDKGSGCSCTRRSKLGANKDDTSKSLCCSSRNLLCCSSIGSSNNNNASDDELESSSSSLTASANSSQKKVDEEYGSGQLVALDKAFSCGLDELLRSSAYVLGKSGVGGIVYKVVLGNGVAVVVRRLGEAGGGVVGEEGQRKLYREFVTEVKAIGGVRHQNIVRLRAFYWSRDEKLTVSDFVSNGNVASALKGRSGQPCISWAIRLRIAKGMSRGLAHLHECSPRKFIHGDIKPTNVLLDDDYNPRISDFGLARLVSLVGDSTAMSGGIMGSYLPHVKSGPIDRPNNYRAPEARLPLGRPTQKWDVYSFGVLLLEMLTGKSPEFSAPSSASTSSSPMESGELVRWVRKGLDVERPLSEMVDAAIVKEVDAKEVMGVFNVALACTETDPESRPRMKAVCDTLEKIGS